jgi:aldehyde:ferredoxin oxidoreductase
MAKTFGWAGKVLWVDLTKRKVTTMPSSDFEPEKYIGGVGLNSRIFWELGAPKVAAFHPDSPLLISIGPLTGAPGPFNRAEVSGIAPQSYPQELFAYSGLGGKFPSELKYAGYDGIVVLGKSDKPVYLVVEDNSAVIKDAQQLWGLDTFETQKTLGDSHPKAAVLTIGPAGETECRFAIILNETANAAGQGGYGGVMGSKNLKAIVVRGTGSHKIAKPDKFLDLVAERHAAGEWLAGGAQSWGRTPLCGDPIRGEMVAKYLKRFAGCHGCPYQCMGFYDMPGVGKGAQMCVESWYGIIDRASSEGYWEGNILSQKLGINNFELMGMMQFVLTAIGSGAVTEQDLGLASIPQIDHAKDPKHGSPKVHHEFLAALLDGIVEGKSPLAQGTARAAQQLGPSAIKVYQKLYPAYGYTSHWITNVPAALHWATDSRDPFNSCHDYLSFGTDAGIAKHFGLPGGDILDPKGDTPGYKGTKNVYERAEHQAAWVQNHQSLKNSLPVCEYSSMPETFYHPPQMDIRMFESKILSAITGVDYDVARLWEAGERIWNLRRAIMVRRENRARKDDTLSSAWFEHSETDMGLADPLDRKQWDDLVTRYYELRGWDVKTGKPRRSKLEALGMKNVAGRIAQGSSCNWFAGERATDSTGFG